VALGLLWLELRLLDRILVPADDQEKDSAAANVAALLFPKGNPQKTILTTSDKAT
jgi:hypothetical protein